VPALRRALALKRLVSALLISASRALVAAAWLSATAASGAQDPTCFRACLTPRVKQSDISDDMIRYQMTVCRDACEDETRLKLREMGLDARLSACVPQPLSDAEFKTVRAASASFFTYASSFTWDIRNVLPGKVIRKVEISYPTLDLDETTATGGGTVLPGETATMLVNVIFVGYPAMNYALRVKAIYACAID
jgi:hypothetical protein